MKISKPPTREQEEEVQPSADGLRTVLFPIANWFWSRTKQLSVTTWVLLVGTTAVSGAFASRVLGGGVQATIAIPAVIGAVLLLLLCSAALGEIKRTTPRNTHWDKLAFFLTCSAVMFALAIGILGVWKLALTLQLWTPSHASAEADWVRSGAITGFLSEANDKTRAAFEDDVASKATSIPCTTSVGNLLTVFYQNGSGFVKIQLVGFSSKVREDCELRFKSSGSPGEVVEPRVYLVAPGSPRPKSVPPDSSPTLRARVYKFTNVGLGDIAVATAIYNGPFVADALPRNANIHRDWTNVEIKDLAARGPLNHFFFVKGGDQPIDFKHVYTFRHAQDALFREVRPEFISTSAIPSELLHCLREICREAYSDYRGLKEKGQLPGYITDEIIEAFHNLPSDFESGKGWSSDVANLQSYNRTYFHEQIYQ